MTYNENQPNKELLEYTTEIVTAHVSNNSVAFPDLPKLIHQVYETLASVECPPSMPERPKPAVPIRKSVTDDYIVCLEDGKKLKTLKRHLKVSFNMEPEEYRARWNLPPDYPMVAPSDAARRSALAKKIGFGKRNARGERLRKP